MNNPGENMNVFSHGQGRYGRGPSSFWMHDPEVVFGEIGLKRGDSFLDLGCGPGDYAIYVAGVVGFNGAVYAIDKCAEMVNDLIKKADSQGFENIFGVVSDITATLPVADHCIDICFMSTVLHTQDVKKAMSQLLGEIRRVLKPDGRLVIIECKKQDAPFGPPRQARLSPEEIEALTTPGGFEKTGFTDLGYNYMIQFKPKL
ncbi:MAG: methyltransferase domain-containing protein [Dehalococcoidales bacterium]|nr:methyltransferase domain-containing protein [Dehalococcoidales bacterium]